MRRRQHHIERRRFLVAEIERAVRPDIGLDTLQEAESMAERGVDLLDRAALIGRFGLHFGYAYRSQRWNVGSSDLLEDVAEDYFDYSGSTHLVRAGISF